MFCVLEDGFEFDTPLLLFCEESYRQMNQAKRGEESSARRLSCKPYSLGPPLGARCFLPQVKASV